MKTNSLLNAGLALAVPMTLLTSACSMEPEDFGFLELSQAQFGVEEEQAQGGFGGRSDSMTQWQDCVELTDEQQAQLEALHQSMHDEMAPLKDEMHGIRDEMQALWSEPQPNREAILAIHIAMEEPVRQLLQGMVAFDIQAQALLTAEQKQTLFACMGECGSSNEASPTESENAAGMSSGSCSRGEGNGWGSHDSGDRGARASLDLSPTQMIQSLSMLWDLRNKTSDEMNQLEASHTEMCQLWRVEEPSQKDIVASFERMLPPLQSLLQDLVDFRIEFGEILDAGQREKLAEHMSERRGHMETDGDA